MDINKKYSQWIEWFQLILVSFFSALFAWYLIRFLTDLTTLYFSYDLNIHAIMNLSGVHFLSPVNSSQWTRDAIVTIYLSGPFMNLVLGLGFFITYTFVPRKTQSFSFFMLWVMIFSFTLMFATFVENSLQHTGVYRVSQLMHISGAFLVVSAVVALYFLYLTGLSIGKLMMLSLPPRHTSEGRMKTSYFLSAFVIPWALVFAFCFMETNLSIRIIYLLGSLILLPFIWMRGSETKGVHLKALPPLMWMDTVSIILFLIGVLILRQIIASGIVLK